MLSKLGNGTVGFEIEELRIAQCKHERLVHLDRIGERGGDIVAEEVNNSLGIGINRQGEKLDDDWETRRIVECEIDDLKDQ